MTTEEEGRQGCIFFKFSEVMIVLFETETLSLPARKGTKSAVKNITK